MTSWVMMLQQFLFRTTLIFLKIVKRIYLKTREKQSGSSSH